MPSCIGPSTTGFGTTLSLASTAKTILRVWSEITARSGIENGVDLASK